MSNFKSVALSSPNTETMSCFNVLSGFEVGLVLVYIFCTSDIRWAYNVVYMYTNIFFRISVVHGVFGVGVLGVRSFCG